MIKKFEEFINEMYSPTSFKRGVFDFIDYIDSIGVTNDSDRSEIYDIAVNNNNFYYTPEETENILKRLPGCEDIEGRTNAIKTVFYGTDEDLKDWCGNIECPVVRGVNGKLLTGVVMYCDFVDAYADDDSFEYLKGVVSEYALEHNIHNEEHDEFIDSFEVEEVDLDKEFGWVEK